MDTLSAKRHGRRPIPQWIFLNLGSCAVLRRYANYRDVRIWPIQQYNFRRKEDGRGGANTTPFERPVIFVNYDELPLDSKPMCTLRSVGGYTNLPYRSTSLCQSK